MRRGEPEHCWNKHRKAGVPRTSGWVEEYH